MTTTFWTIASARKLAPKEAAIGDRRPYAGHLDEATVATRNGLLMQVIHLRGFPYETVSDEELNYRKSVRETLVRGAASPRLALYHHVVRRRTSRPLQPLPTIRSAAAGPA
jgi:type IV secretion system protein VirB4